MPTRFQENVYPTRLLGTFLFSTRLFDFQKYSPLPSYQGLPFY